MKGDKRFIRQTSFCATIPAALSLAIVTLQVLVVVASPLATGRGANATTHLRPRSAASKELASVIRRMHLAAIRKSTTGARRKLLTAEAGGEGSDATGGESGGEQEVDLGGDQVEEQTGEHVVEQAESEGDSEDVAGGGEEETESAQDGEQEETQQDQQAPSSAEASTSDRTVESAGDREIDAGVVRASMRKEGWSQHHMHTNKTHLSKMLMKLIKEYNIRSMLDIPCRNSLEIMPGLLPQLDLDVIGFKYYCVDSERNRHEDLEGLFGEAGSPEIMHVEPHAAGTLPKTDLVFSWDGPQDWGVSNTWSFLSGLRSVRPKYLLITNNPVKGKNGDQGLVNLRKPPFHFEKATRVISNVWNDDNPKKQLLLYQLEDIRPGF